MAASDCRQAGSETPDLFEEAHWLYAFCRERLFRDDTKQIARTLFGTDTAPDARVLELGCGPGFYACKLAKLFPGVEAIGVDLSPELVEWARRRARSKHLTNATFQLGNAFDLSGFAGQMDAVIISRLFLIVPQKERVLAEVFSVLKAGGRLFIAEPISSFRSRVPLWMMKTTAAMTSFFRRHRGPDDARVMTGQDFRSLAASQPWESVEFLRDWRYQYAICIKPQSVAELLVAEPLVTELLVTDPLVTDPLVEDTLAADSTPPAKLLAVEETSAA
jgi:arsenite methyltransferase